MSDDTECTADTLIGAIKERVAIAYADHRAGCPAITRKRCICGVEGYNAGMAMAMHLACSEIRHYFDSVARACTRVPVPARRGATP